MLREYAEIISNGAERIMQMAETQSEHRRSLEAKVIDSDITRSKQGLYLGATITIASIIGGSITAILGQPLVGGAIAAIPSASVLGVFMYGSAMRSKERIEKAKVMTGKN